MQTSVPFKGFDEFLLIGAIYSASYIFRIWMNISFIKLYECWSFCMLVNLTVGMLTCCLALLQTSLNCKPCSIGRKVACKVILWYDVLCMRCVYDAGCPSFSEIWLHLYWGWLMQFSQWTIMHGYDFFCQKERGLTAYSLLKMGYFFAGCVSVVSMVTLPPLQC